MILSELYEKTIITILKEMGTLTVGELTDRMNEKFKMTFKDKDIETFIQDYWRKKKYPLIIKEKDTKSYRLISDEEKESLYQFLLDKKENISPEDVVNFVTNNELNDTIYIDRIYATAILEEYHINYEEFLEKTGYFIVRDFRDNYMVLEKKIIYRLIEVIENKERVFEEIELVNILNPILKNEFGYQSTIKDYFFNRLAISLIFYRESKNRFLLCHNERIISMKVLNPFIDSVFNTHKGNAMYSAEINYRLLSVLENEEDLLLFANNLSEEILHSYLLENAELFDIQLVEEGQFIKNDLSETDIINVIHHLKEELVQDHIVTKEKAFNIIDNYFEREVKQEDKAIILKHLSGELNIITVGNAIIYNDMITIDNLILHTLSLSNEPLTFVEIMDSIEARQYLFSLSVDSQDTLRNEVTNALLNFVNQEKLLFDNEQYSLLREPKLSSFFKEINTDYYLELLDILQFNDTYNVNADKVLSVVQFIDVEKEAVHISDFDENVYLKQLEYNLVSDYIEVFSNDKNNTNEEETVVENITDTEKIEETDETIEENDSDNI